MKILIAADGSKFTKKMLAYLTTHSEIFSVGHAYTVLTVQPRMPHGAQVAIGQAGLKSFYEDESESVLQPVYKFLLRHGIDAKSAHKVGQPGEVISRFAEAGKFDLIVMGSHGHGTLVNLMMGSVATQVLAGCKVPVLIVR